MDFLKNAAEQAFVKEEFGGNSNNNNNQNQNQNNNNNNQNNQNNQNQGQNNGGNGQYDKYIGEGVDYVEKTYFHTDVNNKSQDVQARDQKVESFISENVSGFLNRN